MSGLAVYRKAIMAAAGSVLTWAGAAYVPDGHIGRAEWYALAIALATVGGVYVAPNANRAAAPQQADVQPIPGEA